MKLLVVLFLLGIVLSIKAKKYTTQAIGCVKCYGQAMPYVKVQLKDKDLGFDDTFVTGRADGNGCFNIQGRAGDLFGKPDPYIRVEYQYSGFYGKMEVEYIITGKNRWGKTSTRNYKKYINFGTINFNSISCKSYVYFYNAMKDFRFRAQRNIPGGTLHIRTGVILHGGTPYAMTNIIRIPKKYKSSQITTRLARHELSHIVRHNYDGSAVHFASDAVKYWYLQSHSCGKSTNYGFAFNEGWAAFWANSCRGNYGSSPTKYYYEGNVAKALRKLKAVCYSSDAKFVNVLRWNPGKIHSFASFNSKYKNHYGCSI